MYSYQERLEYLAEIRERVCSRCIERPPGGPPCGPLGKRCGVEVNLEHFIDSVRAVHSNSMEPYIDSHHSVVCSCCPASPTSQCPCPLDYLLLLAVEAVEAVDERRAARQQNGHA
jgi:hypothetical protein